MTCLCRECIKGEDAADHEARRLLARHLSKWQRRNLNTNGGFAVKGNETGRRYWISKEGDVHRPRDQRHFCLMVFDENHSEVPEADAILAKKILLECNEHLFLSTAYDTLTGRPQR